MQRCLPPLKRWAPHRLPGAARGRLDTGDLVQEAALHVLSHLETFATQCPNATQQIARLCVVVWPPVRSSV